MEARADQRGVAVFSSWSSLQVGSELFPACRVFAVHLVSRAGSEPTLRTSGVDGGAAPPTPRPAGWAEAQLEGMSGAHCAVKQFRGFALFPVQGVSPLPPCEACRVERGSERVEAVSRRGRGRADAQRRGLQTDTDVVLCVILLCGWARGWVTPESSSMSRACGACLA